MEGVFNLEAQKSKLKTSLVKIINSRSNLSDFHVFQV